MARRKHDGPLPSREMTKQAMEARQTGLTCQYCEKPILKSVSYLLDAVKDEGGYVTGTVVSGFTIGYVQGYDDRWCSLKCCRKFANACYRSGQRIVRKKPTAA